MGIDLMGSFFGVVGVFVVMVVGIVWALTRRGK